MYQFDASLLNNVDVISAACTDMDNNSKAKVDIKADMEKAGLLMDELIKMFDQREQILNTV